MKKYFFLFIVIIAVGCKIQKSDIKEAQCPTPIKKVFPDYPDILKTGDITGRVIISVLVDENGNVIKTKMVKSIHQIVDSVSIEAAINWKFESGYIVDKNDNRIKSKFWFPIEFHWGLL